MKKTTAKSVKQSLSPRASFGTLPPELITQIALLLDVPTALSLARVCRRTTEAAEAVIWRHLDFTVDEKSSRLQPWKAEMDEECYRLALSDRAARIEKLATERRLRAVDRMTMLPRAGVTQVLVRMLQRAATRLGELRVMGRQSDSAYRGGGRPDDHDMLDLRLLDWESELPALTKVELGYTAVRFAGFIPLLCKLAPNLLSLDVTVRHFFSLSRLATSFPAFPPATQIRSLTLDCGWDADDPEDAADAISILSIIEFSPNLRQLAIKYDGGNHESAVQTTLAAHVGLQDLYWLVDSLTEGVGGGTPQGGFASLRRLVLCRDTWDEVFHGLFPLPALEIVHFRSRANDDSAEFTNDDKACCVLAASPQAVFADPSPSQPMTLGLAQWLRSTPRLRVINVISSLVVLRGHLIFGQLDAIEQSGELTGYVRSLCHGASELLHARMLLNLTWDWNAQVVGGIAVPIGLRGAMWHDIQMDNLRKETFPGQPSAIWRNFTDFEGRVVPLSVIQRMKEVEGYEGVWEGRGIEVGEAAWKVLTDWRDAAVAAET